MNIIKSILAFPFNLLYRILAAILPTRKTAWRILRYQIAILGWVLVLVLAQKHYNLRCSVDIGWFPTKQACDEVVQDRFASQEVDRQERESEPPVMSEGNKQALRDWDKSIDN